MKLGDVDLFICEELDLAVHVAVQGGNYAVGDLLGRTASVVFLSDKDRSFTHSHKTVHSKL